MIFTCFSGKDRYTAAQSICYHLKNFGITVWYDFDELFIGDNGDYVNFDIGINQALFAIIIISENTFFSTGAIAEIEIIKKLYDSEKIEVLPILYNLTREKIPEEYSWIEELIYGSISNTSGTYDVALQIISKVFKWLVEKRNCLYLDEYIYKSSNKSESKFLIETIELYQSVDCNNFNAKAAIIFMLYKYIKHYYFLNSVPQYMVYPFERIINYTKLNITTNFKEMKTLEYAMILLLDFIDTQNPR